MFGDFVKWGPQWAQIPIFGAWGGPQGPKTHFFHFNIPEWGKSFNLICHNRYVWWLCEMGPLNGPKYPFLGPGVGPGSQNSFFHFNLPEWGKSFNLICHNKYVSWLWAFKPPNAPPKTPFWALEQTHDPKTHFFHFDVHEGVKPFNLICHKVQFSLFLEILNPGAKKAFWPFSLKRKKIVKNFFRRFHWYVKGFFSA